MSRIKYTSAFNPNDERHLPMLWAARWWWNYLALRQHTFGKRVEGLLTDRETFTLAVYNHCMIQHDRLRAKVPGSWDEDLPPIIITVNRTPGWFLWEVFEDLIGRDATSLFQPCASNRNTDFGRAGMIWRPLHIDATFYPHPEGRHEEHAFKLYPGVSWTYNGRYDWCTQFHRAYDLHELG